MPQPQNAAFQERDERRLTIILYIGSLLILLILLHATYSNMRRYSASNEQVRTLNYALIELDNILAGLRDRETGIRGYLLTEDSTYLEPHVKAVEHRHDHLLRIDSLLGDPQWRPFLDMLHLRVEEVENRLGALLNDTAALRMMKAGREPQLGRGKIAMDNLRDAHDRLTDQIRAEREAMIKQERAVGMGAPGMILLYSVLAILATALLFWRLFRAMRINEAAKIALQQKVADLDKEMEARTSVQGMLQKVLDTSPNGIMAFRSIRNQAGQIVDFEILSSNSEAKAIVKRDDLVGKRLLTELPGDRAAGLFEAYVEVVKTGTPFRREFHYENDGVDLWFSGHAVRLEDGFMITFTDISEQKRAQEITAEADRIALTGQITRTVAHEVRNPLTNIHLAMEQLQDEVSDRKETTGPFFQIVERNLKRIGTLINGMLESSRKRELTLAPCRMQDIVQSTIRQVEDRLALKQMRSEVSVAAELPEVMVDRDLLNLAIANIAVNAVEAMEPGRGLLTLRAYRHGDEVLLDIEDNGRGIPPQNINRLFEPFYSSRPGGLGLGLTTTRTILNSHGIILDVRSSVGIGTTFSLHFPPGITVGA